MKIRPIQKVVRVCGTLRLARQGKRSEVLTSLNLEVDYLENKKWIMPEALLSKPLLRRGE